MSKILLSSCMLILFCSHCTTTDGAGENQKVTSKRGSKVIEAPVPVVKKSECYPLKLPLGKALPVYVKQESGGFVVVRVERPCLTEDGIVGAQKQSPWMAMGIPCAGTTGTSRIRGKSYRPKMISFVMAISCPMVPSDPLQVESIAREQIGIQIDAPLVAYNPLSVQYWEIEGLSDAGIGPEVELRSTYAVGDAWKEFARKERVLNISLYGRESAWVSDHNFYEAKVELSFESIHEFSAKLLSVRVLDAASFKSVKKRCESHSRRFDCDRVLGTEL